MLEQELLETFEKKYNTRQTARKKAGTAKKAPAAKKTPTKAPAKSASKRKRVSSPTPSSTPATTAVYSQPPPLPTSNSNEFEKVVAELEKMRDSERKYALKCAELEGTVKQMQMRLDEKDADIAYFKESLRSLSSK